jgi:hypothetical protein
VARFPNTIRLTIAFVTGLELCRVPNIDPSTPIAQRLQAWHAFGLGCTPFAHHYSGHLFRFLFLRILRCFTSPGRRLHKRRLDCSRRVPPFRYPRITGCLLLPAAFRSWLRLSSASGAKASPTCPLYLNLINPLFRLLCYHYIYDSPGILLRRI